MHMTIDKTIIFLHVGISWNEILHFKWEGSLFELFMLLYHQQNLMLNIEDGVCFKGGSM